MSTLQWIDDHFLNFIGILFVLCVAAGYLIDKWRGRNG